MILGEAECTYIEGTDSLEYGDHRSQMMMFCGHDEFCKSFNSQRVLERAKANVEKYYDVVGVLEEFNKTLSVMENFMPQYFRGASEAYKHHGTSGRAENKFKPSVSEEIKAMVRANFSREFEFYDFCKQRLFKQYDSIKLPQLALT